MTFLRVAAYITAYEDAPALNLCLQAIADQWGPHPHPRSAASDQRVEQVLVVDNSSQPLALAPVSNLPVQVQHHPENIGIAAGIGIAIDWAVAQGYDFLWMFDQDSQPTPDCLQRLLQVYQERSRPDYPIGILGPTALDARTGEIVRPARFLADRFEGYKAPSTSEPFECDAPITSGSLLWLPTRAQVPPPDRRLFIDGVDLEYGLRLRQAGFHNLIVPRAIMYHRFGEPVTLELWGRRKIIQVYSPLRHYYICRNHTYLELAHARGRFWWTCSIRRIKYAVMTIAMILVWNPGPKGYKVWACVLGTYRGFCGDLTGF
jgi:rhamnosyltransferase